MTTPAENVNLSVPGGGTYNWHIGPVTEVKPWAGPYITLDHKVRPESVNNPIRIDGTRGPSGFDHKWLLFRMPYVTFDADLFGSVIQADGSIGAILANLTAENMALPFASWSRSNGGVIFPLSVDQKARTAFFNKVRKGTAEFGESLAEMRETAGFVKSLATRTGVAFTGIANAAGMRRSDVSQLFKRLKGMPAKQAISRGRELAGKAGAQSVSDWLGWQWGAKPLCGDIEDSTRELERLVLRDRPDIGYREVIRAGAGMVDEDQEIDLDCTFPYAKTTARFSTVTQAHYSVTVGYPIPDAMRLEQLGLRNPFSTAWNVMRFSHLIDYAVGIGDWLESLTPVLNGYVNQQFIEGSISRIQKSVMTGYETKISEPSYGTFQQLAAGKGTYQGGRFERTVLDTWPVPASLPSIKTRLGLTQMANSISALTVLTGSLTGRPLF